LWSVTSSYPASLT